MDGQAISKIVFLVFILAIALYIMFDNKSPKIIEKFENTPVALQATAVPQPNDITSTPLTTPVSGILSTSAQQKNDNKTPRQIIIDVYKELYGADPNDNEIAFYVKFFEGKEPCHDYIKEIIATSAPTLQKTLKAGVLPTVPDTPIGNEREVIAIFKDILDRFPDTEELQYYTTFAQQGPANIQKMKVMLIESAEYRRLQSMQNNVAYGQLIGGVTDRQLTLMVTNVYNSLTGLGDKIDNETMQFLKRKYLEFQLNTDIFTKFVKDFVLFKPSQVTAPQSKETFVNSETTNSRRANSAITDSLIKKGVRENFENSPFDTSKIIDTVKSYANTNILKKYSPNNIFNGNSDKFSKEVNYEHYADMAKLGEACDSTSCERGSTCFSKAGETNKFCKVVLWPNDTGCSSKANYECMQGLTCTNDVCLAPNATKQDVQPEGTQTQDTQPVQSQDVQEVQQAQPQVTKKFKQKKSQVAQDVQDVQQEQPQVTKQEQPQVSQDVLPQKNSVSCWFDKDKLDNDNISNSRQTLASTIHDRNREELKNVCQRNKSFSKYHYDDMVLIPGQEWSVPQSRPPVCLGSTNNYNPSVEQTSLIGTLLNTR